MKNGKDGWIAMAGCLSRRINHGRSEKAALSPRSGKAERNAEIVNTVKKYNVSLEELAQFFEERRNNVPGPSRILSKTEKEPSELFDSEGYVMETEENEDE